MVCVIEKQFGKCRCGLRLADCQGRRHSGGSRLVVPEEDGNEPHLYGVWRCNIYNLVPHFHVAKGALALPLNA
jgi:hypothetical protein